MHHLRSNECSLSVIGGNNWVMHFIGAAYGYARGTVKVFYSEIGNRLGFYIIHFMSA
jgi:hypothetical protein